MKKIFFVPIFLILISAFGACAETGEVSGTPPQKRHSAVTAPLNAYPKLPYREFIFPLNKVPSSHSPGIVELPGGELFAVWYAPGPGSNNKGVIWGSRRPPGARRWTTPFIVNQTANRSNKNPVIYLTRDKKLLLFWSEEERFFKWPRDRLRMKTSQDSGRTWGEVRPIGTPTGFLPRTHPVTLHDGRILLPIYTDFFTSSAVISSGDGGLTWGNLRWILFFWGIQPTIIQRSDSSLFALTRTGMWPRLSWQAVSTDGGNSWKGQRVSRIKNPGSSIEMAKLRDGHVVLVFNDSKTDRAGLSIALSCDDGRTWACRRVIEYKPGRVNCYPSVIQDAYGLIHVVYSYDGRQTIAHFVTDERWIEGGRR
jgi:predicted neuraminidase